jgi:hypothetical protein
VVQLQKLGKCHQVVKIDDKIVKQLILKTHLSKTYYPIKKQQDIQVPPAGLYSFDNSLTDVHTLEEASQYNFELKDVHRPISQSVMVMF